MENINPAFNVKEFVWSNIKDLPKDSLNEILSFIVYVRKKTYQPDLFKFQYPPLYEELSNLDKFEATHLLEEFQDYKTLYPNE